MISQLLRLARAGKREPAATVSPVPTLDEMWPLMSLEVARARRYEHALSVVALSAAAVGSETPQGRLADIVAFDPRTGWYVLLLPETDTDGVAGLMARLQLDPTVEPLRHATFPDDGLTLDGLIEKVLS